MSSIQISRLAPGQAAQAGKLFSLMAIVFGEAGEELSEEYVRDALRNDAFWAVAALDGSIVIGGLTAHVLPMTRSECSELMIYDVAIHPDFQRQGVGTQLIEWTRTRAAQCGLSTIFVLADDVDKHAVDFYKKTGASPSSVTLLSWGDQDA